MTAASPPSRDVGRAMARIRSLQDGDVGVAEVVACGGRAIEPLRALLFERETSGLFETRRRAVDALAALGAHDVLTDFVETPHDPIDPVERVGDDAVIDAAALALSVVCDERIFAALMTVARRRLLPGVVAALGIFRRPESIPVLVAALGEDACRRAAEGALVKLGKRGRKALITALRPQPAAGGESELRARRALLEVLLAIGIDAGTWPSLGHLMRDDDPKIRLLACRICLAYVEPTEKEKTVQHLVSMLPRVDWMMREEIEACLVDHFDIARSTIDALLAASGNDAVEMRCFRRVKRRARVRARIDG
jgi:hypothetical protein